MATKPAAYPAFMRGVSNRCRARGRAAYAPLSSSEGERDVELDDVVTLSIHRVVEGSAVREPRPQPALAAQLEVEPGSETEGALLAGRRVARHGRGVREPALQAHLDAEGHLRRKEMAGMETRSEVRAAPVLGLGSPDARELQERDLRLERQAGRDPGQPQAADHGPVVHGEERIVHRRAGGDGRALGR